MSTRWIFGVVALAALSGSAARADIVIAVDELGHGIGTTSQGFLSTDPGPGGLGGVLTYNLPFAGLQGDVLLFNATEGLGDVIRFNANGTLIFYSDNIGGIDALGDTPTPPTGSYTNQFTITEVGPEGNNFALYTPTANQPGFNPATPTSYIFVSDGTVPEPASFVLLGVGALGMIAYGRRRSAARRAA